jgi:haloalkane dehalogenase
MQRRDFLITTSISLAGTLLGGQGALGVALSHDALADGPTLDVAQYRKRRRYARTRFGDIAYIERGAGPAALFLHGLPLNGLQWRGAVERLAAHRRCIAPDLLSLGHTRVAPGQSVAPTAQVAMLATLLDGLGVQDVDLIASDSGGLIAQLFVARYPARVRSLLLTNCDEEQDSPPAAVKPIVAAALEGKSTDIFVKWLADKSSARLPDAIGGAAYANPETLSDEVIEYYFAPLISSAERKAMSDAFLIGLEPNPLAGIGPALQRCKAPVRIVWGSADTIFSADSAARLDRSFGNSRGVRVLDGYKLFWPEERPDVIAEEAMRLWGVAG